MGIVEYLTELAARLELAPAEQRDRLLGETAEHLRDLADESLQDGRSLREAEELATRSFGAVEEVANQFILTALVGYTGEHLTLRLRRNGVVKAVLVTASLLFGLVHGGAVGIALPAGMAAISAVVLGYYAVTIGPVRTGEPTPSTLERQTAALRRVVRTLPWQSTAVAGWLVAWFVVALVSSRGSLGAVPLLGAPIAVATMLAAVGMARGAAREIDVVDHRCAVFMELVSKSIEGGEATMSKKASGDGRARQTAESVISELEAGDFDALFGRFSDEMKWSVPRQEVERVWSAVVVANGPLRSRGEPRERPATLLRRVVGGGAAPTLYDFPLTFERGEAHVQVAVDPEQRVTGMVVRPGQPTGQFGR